MRDLPNDTSLFQCVECLADGRGAPVGVDVGKFQAVSNQTGRAEEEVLGKVGWNTGGILGEVAPVGLQDGKLGATARRGICIVYEFAECFRHASGKKVIPQQ
jgi:hypothetical protein